MANVLYYRLSKNSLNQAKSTLNRVLRYGMLLDFFIYTCAVKNLCLLFSFSIVLFIYSCKNTK